MHVAIECSTWVNPRGYGRFTREFTKALLRAPSGHRFTLVVDTGAAAAIDLPDAPRIVAPTRHSVVSAAAADGARSPSDLWRMGAAMSRRDFDAVVFPTLYSYVPVLSRAHLTVVVHDAMPETLPDLVLGSPRARLLWKAKTWLACRRANMVATVSDASAAEIRRSLPIPTGASVVVLTEGVDQVFTPMPGSDDRADRARWVSDDTPYVLYVGGLSPHKRVAALVEAFGKLASRPEHGSLRLVLAGPGEIDTFKSDDRGLSTALAELGTVRDRVVHTGFVSDAALAALYRGAACVVLPSIAEGFGLPALEAMACGAPVLVARTAALEEVCADAVAYFDRIEGLPAALAQLLNDAGRRASLAAAGPVRTRHFSWDEAARRWLAALESSRGTPPC